MNDSMRTGSSRSGLEGGSPRRDLVIVGLATLVAGWLFAQWELNEWMFALTRQWEPLQLDELPAVLVVLATCLAWYAWRRFRDARVEILKRRAAEERLESLLLENRRLAQQYLRAQESERKSLARELHDELGQYLNAIKTDAVSIQGKVPDGQQATVLSTIIQHTDHLHTVVRDLIRELRPVALDELGLQAALEHYLDNCQQRMRRVRFDVVFEGDLDNLGEAINLAIYRMTQEAVTNVARHASATRLTIRVARSRELDAGDAVTLSITDDGRGAELGETHDGLGLIGMRERVEMLGGQLHIATSPGRGFDLLARIPVSD